MTESAGRARLIEHWSVAVNRNGENILTIESNCLSGKDLTPEDEETVRNCAQHLLSFVGAADTLAGQEATKQLPVSIDAHIDARAKAIGGSRSHLQDVEALATFGKECALLALAGQEEAPKQKDGEEEDHARGGSVPGTPHGDLPQRALGDK